MLKVAPGGWCETFAPFRESALRTCMIYNKYHTESCVTSNICVRVNIYRVATIEPQNVFYFFLRFSTFISLPVLLLNFPHLSLFSPFPHPNLSFSPLSVNLLLCSFPYPCSPASLVSTPIAKLICLCVFMYVYL